MNRRNFMTTLGIGMTGLVTSKLLGENINKNIESSNQENKKVVWKNTRSLAKAFDTIEAMGLTVSWVGMSQELFNEAKEQEAQGTMELSYLINFDKNKLWGADIYTDTTSVNEIYCGSGTGVITVAKIE
jgi:hypothetical protein